MKSQYDVVIAGAGAGGGFAAMALTEQGLKVLLLERGPRYDYTKDYPMNHPNWESRLDPFSAVYRTVTYGPTAAIAPADHPLCGGRYQQGTLKYAQPRNRGRFRYQRAVGVGGSTLIYQGEAHRFVEHAFKPRTHFGWGRDWPLDYAELAPFYDKAEEILGVAGDPGNPFKPERGPFPTPAHALSTRSQLAKKGADKLGWKLLANSLALPSRSVDGRTPCQKSGGCIRGCVFGAKSSVDLTAIHRAEQTGRLTLIPEARVTGIETDRTGNVAGFTYRHEGVTKKALAAVFILALGAVETPRLLLASCCPRHPDGIGNQHDQVGRNSMETIAALLQCRWDKPIHSYKGPPLDARIWDYALPRPPLKTGFVLGVAGTLGTHTGPLSCALGVPGIGLEHKQEVRERFGREVQLFGIAEHIPHRNNRITLSPKKDQDGVPLVTIYSDYHVEDRRTLKFMIDQIIAWADACELDQRHQLISTYADPNAAHVGGTCRMGTDPAASVTDPYGRVHGMSNLYISDGSILPTLGAGDSPSLTIQALALRMAGRIT